MKADNREQLCIRYFVRGLRDRCFFNGFNIFVETLLIKWSVGNSRLRRLVIDIHPSHWFLLLYVSLFPSIFSLVELFSFRFFFLSLFAFLLLASFLLRLGIHRELYVIWFQHQLFYTDLRQWSELLSVWSKQNLLWRNQSNLDNAYLDILYRRRSEYCWYIGTKVIQLSIRILLTAADAYVLISLT